MFVGAFRVKAADKIYTCALESGLSPGVTTSSQRVRSSLPAPPEDAEVSNKISAQLLTAEAACKDATTWGADSAPCKTTSSADTGADRPFEEYNESALILITSPAKMVQSELVINRPDPENHVHSGRVPSSRTSTNSEQGLVFPD